MCGRQGRQDKIVSRPKLFRLEVEVDLRVILHSLQHHFWWIKNVRTKMFRGRLGGPLTVLHPESVTTTPLSTIWNNAFFTAAPFSFFPFLLFPFPFSFFLFLFPFSFFLPLFVPFPFSLSLLLSTTCSRDHLKSLIFTFLVLDPFFSFCINFSSVWWMLPKKLSSFCFVFLFFRLEYV